MEQSIYSISKDKKHKLDTGMQLLKNRYIEMRRDRYVSTIEKMYNVLQKKRTNSYIEFN